MKNLFSLLSCEGTKKKYGKNFAVFFCRTVTELHINYKSYTSYAAQSFLSSVVSHKTLKLKCVVTWLRTKMLVENTSSDRERERRGVKRNTIARGECDWRSKTKANENYVHKRGNWKMPKVFQMALNKRSYTSSPKYIWRIC